MEFLQKHPTALALAVVIWLTWGGLGTEPEAKSKSTEGLPRVSADDVTTRAPDAPELRVRDPFPPLMAPDDGGFGLDAARAAEAQGESADKAEEEQEPEVKIERPKLPKVVVDRRPAFRLRLDSIMAFGPSGSHARINGRTVHLGEAIPGCNDESPPILVGLDGLLASVEYAGERHLLHLDQKPQVDLGGETIRQLRLPGGGLVALPPEYGPLPAGTEVDLFGVLRPEGAGDAAGDAAGDEPDDAAHATDAGADAAAPADAATAEEPGP